MAQKMFFFCILTILLSNFCYCINVKSLNHTMDAFQTAIATWYGPSKGHGSGGACGLGEDVGNRPYSSMISAGNDALFQSGKGCGACYQAFCNPYEYPECTGNPITVTITDQCPGACNNEPVHFDFSGLAFGCMAKSGQDDVLRNRGRIKVQYQKVPCKYNNVNILFKVDAGSNPEFLAIAVENEDGDGTIKSLEIQPDGMTTWDLMSENFGANYEWHVPQIDIGKAYSLRITAGDGKQLVAKNVIPGDWKAGQIFNTNENFFR